MFYAATAVLYSQDLVFNKHSAVKAAFGERFAATGLIDLKHHSAFNRAFDLRQKADYEVAARLTREQAEKLVEDAKAFVAAARDYLASQESTRPI